MRRTASIIAAALSLFAGGAAAAPVFQVKPPALGFPEGAPPGAYRRLIHPFPNWTLICDDNLVAKRRVCDIRQEIEIKGVGVIFTWAVTATEKGPPVMRIRAPSGVGQGGQVTLGFADGSRHAVVMTQCAGGLCEGVVPLGPKLQAHIRNGQDIAISFHARPVGDIRFNSPLRGLSEALKAAQ